MRGRRSALAVTAAAALVAIVPVTSIAGASADQNAEAYVLRWPDSPANPRPLERRTEVGLVYTPEVLAALSARHPADAVRPRIAQAIREGTPIVVMWEFPDGPHDTPAAQRPYDMRIAERVQDRMSWTPPLWIQQNAAGLEELDSRISAQVERPGSGVGVAVMAAFPRDAFVPGRFVYLVSQRTPSEIGTFWSAARYGAIEPPLVHALAR
jgi:hypothetical protein